MAKKTIYLLGILLTIIIATLLNWKFCCGACSTSIIETKSVTEEKPKLEITDIKEEEEEVVPVISIDPLTINDTNGGFAYTSDDNFNFNSSGFSIIKPIAIGVEEGIDKLNTYLKENSSKIVNVTGYYSNDETNESAFPNLGIARSTAIKNYLVSKGISSKQIDTNSDLKDGLIINDTTYISPLAFEINTADDDTSNNEAEELKALGEKIKADPLVLYFKSGQSKINLTKKQRQKIEDISKYLDKVDGASCLITGHTDKTGRRATNIKLGQGRADFARDYLVQNGIPADKTKTFSQGSNSPITTNKTKRGRAKNRRTVITIN